MALLIFYVKHLNTEVLSLSLYLPHQSVIITVHIWSEMSLAASICLYVLLITIYMLFIPCTSWNKNSSLKGFIVEGFYAIFYTECKCFSINSRILKDTTMSLKYRVKINNLISTSCASFSVSGLSNSSLLKSNICLDSTGPNV